MIDLPPSRLCATLFPKFPGILNSGTDHGQMERFKSVYIFLSYSIQGEIIHRSWKMGLICSWNWKFILDYPKKQKIHDDRPEFLCITIVCTERKDGANGIWHLKMMSSFVESSVMYHKVLQELLYMLLRLLILFLHPTWQLSKALNGSICRSKFG